MDCPLELRGTDLCKKIDAMSDLNKLFKKHTQRASCSSVHFFKNSSFSSLSHESGAAEGVGVQVKF